MNIFCQAGIHKWKVIEEKYKDNGAEPVGDVRGEAEVGGTQRRSATR